MAYLASVLYHALSATLSVIVLGFIIYFNSNQLRINLIKSNNIDSRYVYQLS